MSPYRRNFLVGITVLSALGILGWMMLQFGATLATPFSPKVFPITLRAERVDGLAEGSPVLFRGVSVGRVTRVYRSADRPLEVQIDAEIELTPPIPANVIGVINTQSALGGAAVLNLELVAPEPEGQLSAGADLRARYAGYEFLPPEYSALAQELTVTVRQFRESNIIDHLDQEVQNIGEVVDSIQKVVGDPQVQQDLKSAIANVRSVTEKADRLADRLESLTGEASQTMAQARGTIGKTEAEIVALSRALTERLGQFGELIDQVQTITAQVEKGQGTAGMLVNDPRLYENLVDVTRQMELTVTDLRRLVQQWEQEGVPLRLR